MNIWKIDIAHAEVAFKVRHLMVSTIIGVFNKFEGGISAKDDTLDGGSINFTLDTNSINTHNKDRDGHLMSPDFFDVEKFPTILFVSTSIKRTGNELAIVGDLTIKGITKSYFK
jgi:polyisoprenoid-binding protein YceI